MKWKVRPSALQCLHPLPISACYCSSAHDLLQSLPHRKLLLLLLQLQISAHQKRGRYLVPDEQQPFHKAPHLPVSFPCWVSLAVFQPHGSQFITHSCSAGSIWEPRSANYETSPGTFIYYGAKPEVMDTSKVLLSLKGGNSSRSGPQERLYHTCMHTYTQAYLEGRRAALSRLLTLAITALGPSLHLLPLLFFYPRCVYRCVYILQISSQPDHIAKQLLGSSL